MKKILFVLGTRPEVIKLFPLIKMCKKSPHFNVRVCLTNQHPDLSAPLLSQFGIKADHSFAHIPSNLSLQARLANQIEALEPILEQESPSLVVVQGDTTSALSGAFAAFYARIPIAHIEAGLRTEDLHSPWPEEAHRRLIDTLSTYHFAPTADAKRALLAEGIDERSIFIVGNTAIDALSHLEPQLENIATHDLRTILVTIHRRENLGAPLVRICSALRQIAEQAQNVHIILFLHPNPHIRSVITKLLKETPHISLRQPVDYFTFLKIMQGATFIITDSGGVQEEAPYLGKPLLIAREETERPENIKQGTARLVGTCTATIVEHAMELLDSSETLKQMSKKHSPYGEGRSSEEILKILEEALV